MRVHIVDHDDTIPASKDEIRKAVHYYARKLNLKDNLVVFVDFSRENFQDCKRSIGHCSVDEDKFPPTEFFIELNRRRVKSYTAIVRALAHEMVHVKQYATKELRFHADYGLWKGRRYRYADYDYYDYPWEIEAYGREEGLYNRYHESVRKELACLKSAAR